MLDNLIGNIETAGGGSATPSVVDVTYVREPSVSLVTSEAEGHTTLTSGQLRGFQQSTPVDLDTEPDPRVQTQSNNQIETGIASFELNQQTKARAWPLPC